MSESKELPVTLIRGPRGGVTSIKAGAMIKFVESIVFQSRGEFGKAQDAKNLAACHGQGPHCLKKINGSQGSINLVFQNALGNKVELPAIFFEMYA